MNFWQRRTWRKRVKHLRHEARHARFMREDLAPAADIADLRAAEAELQEALGHGEEPALEAAAERLIACARKVLPPRPNPQIREYVEVAAVALAVAFGGFRCYFLQPFKIPTGSMQPTLNGILASPQTGPRLIDRFPLKPITWLLTGDWYTAVRARASGRIEWSHQADGVNYYSVNGVGHGIRETILGRRPNGDLVRETTKSMNVSFRPGDNVSRGQLLACGLVHHGDHVFVNRVAYNFVRPKRGDIVVFSTAQVRYANIRTNNFYIKRLVGLPGETISLEPPYLVANGKKVEEPYPFRRLVQETQRGYNGYELTRDPTARLANEGSRILLGSGQYLMFGDNTRSSLDGRYFGPINKEMLVGPAMMVYWPFTPHFGRIQ